MNGILDLDSNLSRSYDDLLDEECQKEGGCGNGILVEVSQVEDGEQKLSFFAYIERDFFNSIDP